MAEATRDVLAGNIGFFWPQEVRTTADLTDELMIRGYIQQGDDSAIEIRALDEEEPFTRPQTNSSRPPTVALFGAAEKTGLLVPELVSAGHTTQLGGSRASILRYRARTLITGVNLAEVKSSRICSASLVFAEGVTFAGLSAMTQSFKTDPATRRVTEATFTLKSPKAPPPGGRYGAFDLSLEPDWSTSGSGSTRTLRTGLSVVLSASRPRPFSDYRPLLVGIQDLLNLAYDRFVLAESGRAVVHSTSDPDVRPHLWLEDTMVSPPHVANRTSKRGNVPLFTLDDIGGPAGLRRWLKLRDQFPDAAIVVAAGHRHGGSRQPGRLMEVAAAIEFYVNMNRQAGAEWAKRAAAPSHAEGLSKRVGAPFEALVGDHRKWANRFRETYNGVKHDPSFLRDPEELQLLSWSGQVLLLVALLDRAARTKTPSRRILGDYRLEGGSERLRSILGT